MLPEDSWESDIIETLESWSQARPSVESNEDFTENLVEL